jgi:RNA polymerase sigma-70 factor (ECF subfamily)
MEGQAEDRLREFNEHFLKHQGILRALICKVLRYRRDDVPDVLHDVWIKCATAVIRSEVVDFKAWMNQAAFNTALSHLERSDRKFPGVILKDDEELPEPVDPAPAVDVELGRLIACQRVRKAMRRLKRDSPRQAASLELVHLRGMKHGEAAAALGISVGASKSNVSNAKANLCLWLPSDLMEAA